MVGGCEAINASSVTVKMSMATIIGKFFNETFISEHT
jgi:hypothetical protein